MLHSPAALHAHYRLWPGGGLVGLALLAEGAHTHAHVRRAS